MLTQAPKRELFAAGQRWRRHGLDRFAGLRLFVRRMVARLAGAATAIEPSGCRASLAADPVHRPSPAATGHGRPDLCRAASATSFLALGSPDDRKAFTSAIRAFALAGKLGDHLTLIGYGPHRRRLEKWSRALRVEHAVTFAHPANGDARDVAEHDVAILILRQAGGPMMLVGVPTPTSGDAGDGAALDAGALLAAGPAAGGIRSGDIVALSHAMLALRRAGAAPLAGG